ncbi:ATG20 [Candida margitis]|uniref:ATG20 n=1 Tax=Candida margitis TaxID=1775924 RepID=UPI002226E8E2|nr:ATG20 [Candida margitis]KAI5966116.1 ATG20 [Candida margitis]
MSQTPIESPQSQSQGHSITTATEKSTLDANITTPQQQAQQDQGTPQTSYDEDEDNNPFSHHQGLSSFSQLHLNNSSQQPNEELSKSSDEVDESMLLYKTSNKLDKSNSKHNESFNTVNMNFESRVTKLLKPKIRVKIQITEAGKSNEGMNNSSKKYIVYTIKLVNLDAKNDEILTRRRYSDFESLRDVLTKIFPLVIIPPIPPKNYFDFSVFNGFVGQGSIGFGTNNGGGVGVGGGGIGQDRSIGGLGSASSGAAAATAAANANVNTSHATTSSTNNFSNPASYAYINSNHLAKNQLVEHRKRLLSNFLNNCLEIKQIRNLEFFHKFLDPNANWSDEIALIQNQLPKSIYLSNPENGLKTDAIYANLPNPSSSKNTMSFFKDNGKRITKKTNKLIGNSISSSASTIAAEATGVAPTPDTTATEALQKKKQSEYIVDTSGLDEVNKRIMTNFMGLSNDYAELGSMFNSFSLMFSETFSSSSRSEEEGGGGRRGSGIANTSDDDGGVATTTSAAVAVTSNQRVGQDKSNDHDDDDELNFIFDKIGQCFDRSYIAINSLIGDLETQFSEPLGEAVQYTQILHYITKYQSRKLTQKQMLDDDVKYKRKELNQLLKIEQEAGMVEHAIRHQHSSNNSHSHSNNTNNDSTKSKFDLNGGNAATSASAATSTNAYKSAPNGTPITNGASSNNSNATSPTSSASGGGAGLFKLPSFKFKKLTRYVSEIIDQNPQQTRRTKIHELTDKIGVLEKCQDIMLADLSFIYDEIDKNLQQFQIHQLKMIYEILLYYNQVLIGWAKKNIEIWQDVKDEIIKY